MAGSLFHLSARQGAGEQRTEPYKKYGEGAALSVTQYSAKKNYGIPGFARYAGIQVKVG